MKVFQLEQKQFLKVDLKTCWEFFSTPKNLNALTPPDLDFEILSGADEAMHPGQIITYKIGILPWLPMYKARWVTEITHVEKEKCFVDEQRFGPYAMWHHLHRFEKVKGGVEMLDRVHYALGWGPIGDVMQAMMVKDRLQEIFDFRVTALEEMGW